MFGKYEDVILFVLMLGLAIAIFLIISLREENDKLRNKNRDIEKKLSRVRSAISRIFVIIKSNADSMALLRSQMNQVHTWLGEVLFISNLIRDEEGESDPSIVIEELRIRVKREEQRRKKQIDESEYYKGD